jgi:hypothetical protein
VIKEDESNIAVEMSLKQFENP